MGKVKSTDMPVPKAGALCARCAGRLDLPGPHSEAPALLAAQPPVCMETDCYLPIMRLIRSHPEERGGVVTYGNKRPLF